MDFKYGFEENINHVAWTTIVYGDKLVSKGIACAQQYGSPHNKTSMSMGINLHVNVTFETLLLQIPMGNAVFRAGSCN